MPELPEVETIRRGLTQNFMGYTFLSGESFHRRIPKSGTIAPLSEVTGARIKSIDRLGKYLWFSLSDDVALVAHLGMSGQFLIGSKHGADPKYVRARFTLKKGFKRRELFFNDVRAFGWLSLEKLTNGVPTSALAIAADPLNSAFDRDVVIAKMRSRKASIKSVLINQEIMSGVGNIYADESLWLCRIHPETTADSLSEKKLGQLVDTVIEIMRQAIKVGGTSFDPLYVNLNGELGLYQNSLSVYGAEGDPCPRCGRQIRRIAFGNRSSHLCPQCQVKNSR
jgi:formamidopyrimidine-DNA glycosylase